MKEKGTYKEGTDDNKSNKYHSHAHYIFQPQPTCITEFNLWILKCFADGQLSFYSLLSAIPIRACQFLHKEIQIRPDDSYNFICLRAFNSKSISIYIYTVPNL